MYPWCLATVFVVVCKIWNLLLQRQCIHGKTSQHDVTTKAESFGLYRYTSRKPEQHENNYTDWCCLLWFPFASFILLRPNRYLHFSSSDCGSQAKGKVSRNAYTEIAQPAGAVFLFLLAFWAQPHTKITPPLFFSWTLSTCFHASDVHVFIAKMTNQSWIAVFDFFFLFLELLWGLYNSYRALCLSSSFI